MNRLLILFLAGVSLITCTRPIDNGNFVGEWYVLNFEDEKEYWKINEDNEVLFYNQNNDVTGRYYIEKGIYGSYPEVQRILVSFDKKDTLGFDWVETPSEFPTEIPPDTIRFYHSFVMVRNKKPPKTELSKSEIVQYLENSFWEYGFENTKIEFYLSDSLVAQNKKLAYVRMSGCREVSSSNQTWHLDTLTNNLVFGFTTGGGWTEQMFIKEIRTDGFVVDRDEFYWFRKNKVVNKGTPWDLSNMIELDYEQKYLEDTCEL
ncbi:MAG: hypothetical protein JJ892_02265 [Balneola sp.]|nr:hypothetical protein [Balneola sp.]MBO6651201.1 hypothetical protein [Balneola sp.]MBO6710390.1 hypothetical protein [Balneola sp.]MBO6799075.1 hypothetical protein [Balneola sp.]MBO6870915.1 hypothetical protein [Balneola sp.]